MRKKFVTMGEVEVGCTGEEVSRRKETKTKRKLAGKEQVPGGWR